AIRTSIGGCARADRTAGADPVLRYLALVQSVSNARSAPPPPNDDEASDKKRKAS
ncbi:MAG: hypothetical protein JWM74_3136, partial [Myxococcaceae bacterium]|nr:hypothetical protein [Myxococcaceae bacterium]